MALLLVRCRPSWPADPARCAGARAGARPRGGVQPRADPNYVPGQAKRPWDVPADLGRETPEPPADFPAPRSPPATTSSADDDDWLAQFDAVIQSPAALAQAKAASKPAKPTHRYERRSGKERVFLVGVCEKGQVDVYGYGIEESLEELGRLSRAAGLEVAGSTYQVLERPNPRTYIGSGKVVEIATQVDALGIETVIFDDELSPAQLRSLEKELGDDVRVCDRTALILDIFSQRAATREGQLQVELAQMEYQLPRLTRMWTHLERQSGAGQVKGMGEKQIEVDRRIIKSKMSGLRKELDLVRQHRKQHRRRREEKGMPVVALVGYTNAGKSTLLNALSGSEAVFAQDMLFATLDPTTRRVPLPSGKVALVTDTVGFIQKLPTQLVASFRATLEEVEESDLLLHVVDVSSPMAAAQTQAVMGVLGQLEVEGIPVLTVWNKVDQCSDPDAVMEVAKGREDVVAVSASQGTNLPALMAAVEERLNDSTVDCEMLVPYDRGDVVAELHEAGSIQVEDYRAEGTWIKARVPTRVAGQLESFVVGGDWEDTKKRLRRQRRAMMVEPEGGQSVDGGKPGQAGPSRKAPALAAVQGVGVGRQRAGGGRLDPSTMNSRAGVASEDVAPGTARVGVMVGRQRPSAQPAPGQGSGDADAGSEEAQEAREASVPPQ